MKPLRELFPDLLRKQPQKHLPLEEIVRAAWTHLVGQQIAARSHVFRLYRETLIVHIPDRAWQRQLHHLERQLLDRINRLLGRSAVQAIDFRVDQNLVAAAGREQAPLQPPRKGPAREGAAAADAEMEEMAQAIADPELRALFLRTSRKMMRSG